MSATNGTIGRVPTTPLTKQERAFQRGKAREAAYLRGELEVIAVSRTWLAEHGAPDLYAELEALADTGDLEVTRLFRSRQSLIWESAKPTQPDELSYFRRGDKGQAFLFVQAWTA